MLCDHTTLRLPLTLYLRSIFSRAGGVTRQSAELLSWASATLQGRLVKVHCRHHRRREGRSCFRMLVILHAMLLNTTIGWEMAASGCSIR